MRHERRSTSIPQLAASLDDMVSVVERHRPNREPGGEQRVLKQVVHVMVWDEPDGSETITVIGDPDMPALQMKGILHDGLYTVAHEDEDSLTG